MKHYWIKTFWYENPSVLSSVVRANILLSTLHEYRVTNPLPRLTESKLIEDVCEETMVLFKRPRAVISLHLEELHRIIADTRPIGKQWNNLYSASYAYDMRRPAIIGAQTMGNVDQSEDNQKYMYVIIIVLVLVVLGMFFLLRSMRGKARHHTDIENNLHILEAEFKRLFDNPICGYHAIDEHGFISEVNPTLIRWLGYDREEVVGKLKFSDLIDQTMSKDSQKYFADDQHSKLELTLVKKNGMPFHVIMSSISLSDQKINLHKKLFCSLDNTECRQAMDKIQNLNQELEAFTYSVSHDLRAPLRSIDGYSKILQEDYGDRLDAEGNRVLHVIMNNAKRMGKLIDDLLDFARLGRKGIQRSMINMTGLAHNVVRELQLQEPDRKIDITVNELHTTYADVDMIRQVWVSLIENAVKYTGKNPSPSIEISSYKDDGGQVCYKVKDNGVGFDMKYASKLFGVFQRLHKMQDFSGTGVGLAIVKRIISRHEGRVWAESALNEGAVFYFSIPNINGHE